MNLNKEIQDIRLLLEKNAIIDMKPLLQAYRRSLEKVRTEIAKLYAEYAVNDQLQISGVQRYIVLKQLENVLLEQAKQLGYIDIDHTTKILSDVYSESYYRTAFAIDKGLEIAISFAILRPEFIQAAVLSPIEGKMFSDRIWKNKEGLVNSLRVQIEKGLIQGTDYKKLSRIIKNEFEVSAYQSKRLIVTELARVTSQAQSQIYEDSGVVKKVMWDSTLDNKTSEICQRLDGQMWDINSNYPKPPAHPNCRSCLIPVIDVWRPTRKRENIKGVDGTKPIINYTNYENWKKSRGIN